MANLIGHEAGNGGYGQGEPKATAPVLYSTPPLMVCDLQRRGWGGWPFETFAISSKICYKEESGGEGARKTEGRVLEV
jgi:hypothetical protein